MSNKSPIFPMPQPQHFSDYGFDPQVDYFQVLEETRRHKRATTRSIDSKHFKLQKRLSKDDSRKPHHNKTKKKRWWKSALLFFKWNKLTPHHHHHHHVSAIRGGDEDVHQARAKAFRGSISEPIYITESRSGLCTPCLGNSWPSSRPLAGTMFPASKDEMGIPYLNLRELNMEQQRQRNSTSAVPVYLVT
ncbi:hypothetical protein D8674_009640 [Pyrus ussuriensis x Pyrus communis]|uniref:Uncharacterized protein n=1 Tax=Pyrus ussuriensis x Pyrus communis TaxID=2448454 RepID=A0A5N5F8I9_9ROSA|nr:hypothetical protein D8674_009640 [Pyrus ussuriensis x Pyrus communis]